MSTRHAKAPIDLLHKDLASRPDGTRVVLILDPDRLVEWSVEGRYVALMLMLWHPHSSSFTVANAGASPPMMLRNGEIHKMDVEGVPLGLLPERDYDQRNFHVTSGDIVVLFWRTRRSRRGGGRTRLFGRCNGGCRWRRRRRLLLRLVMLLGRGRR